LRAVGVGLGDCVDEEAEGGDDPEDALQEQAGARGSMDGGVGILAAPAAELVGHDDDAPARARAIRAAGCRRRRQSWLLVHLTFLANE
jgi:hypothetical protein